VSQSRLFIRNFVPVTGHKQVVRIQKVNNKWEISPSEAHTAKTWSPKLASSKFPVMSQAPSHLFRCSNLFELKIFVMVTVCVRIEGVRTVWLVGKADYFEGVGFYLD
jgi:hypothetical protein